MDIAAVLSIVQKVLQYLPAAIDAGIAVKNEIDSLLVIVDKAQAGTLTDADIAAVEAELDAKIAEFNAPLED